MLASLLLATARSRPPRTGDGGQGARAGMRRQASTGRRPLCNHRPAIYWRGCDQPDGENCACGYYVLQRPRCGRKGVDIEATSAAHPSVAHTPCLPACRASSTTTSLKTWLLPRASFWSPTCASTSQSATTARRAWTWTPSYSAPSKRWGTGGLGAGEATPDAKVEGGGGRQVEERAGMGGGRR